MNDYRRSNSCWLICQLLCFSLLLQGTGVAEALPLPPKPNLVTADELATARLESMSPETPATDADRPRSGRLERFIDGAGRAAGNALEGLLESSWAPLASHSRGVQVASAGGLLPLPPRLMSAFLAASPRGQAGPPSPPGLSVKSTGEEADIARQAFATKAATEEIPLLAGYNLISIPEKPADASPAAVFSAIAGQLERVEAYDACDLADPWKIYDPADPGASDLTVADHEIGMWVRASATATLPSDGTLPATTTLDLCEGWNLIGFAAGEARHPAAVLSPIAGKWLRVFAYDAFDSVDPWEVYDPNVPEWANDLTVMQPGRGYWVLVTEATTLEIRNQGPPPTVAITSPADLAVITEPTDIAGTVDSDRLDNWALTARPIDDGDAVTLATGNTPVNGILATFDPTLLLNGLYELELTATDIQGQQVSESIAITVEGQMKIGHFTLSYVDLAVPVSGLDIEIVRTYDSRDKQPRDFGVGWRLDIRQGSYVNNREPGVGWQLDTGFLPCDTITETKSHLTAVRLSEQEVYRFALRLQNGVPSTGGGCFADARFDFIDGPLPGTTLDILGQTQVFYANGSDQVIDVDTLAPYEPQNVRLTTRDGRIFDLDLDTGVTRLEDVNGNQLSITPSGITHSSGRGVDFDRDAEGRITRITDPLGRTMSYGHDAAGDLVSFTDRAGAETRYTYDGDHRLLDIENALGVKPVRNEYDADGRLVRHIDAFGKVVELTHDLANRREVVTNRLGASRSMEYDSRGNVIRETDELGKVTIRTFDGRDNLLTETDPLDRTTTFVYNTNSELTTRRDALGNETTLTYNGRSQVLTVTDARGGVTEFGYDTRGNLTTTTDANDVVTSATYDAAGNGLTVTDALGGVTTFEYDTFGNQTREIDSEGNDVVSTYDAMGNRLTETRTRTLADGSTQQLETSFTYDDLDRLITTDAADGTTRSTSFDLLGKITELTDPLGRATSFSYDLMGRLTSVSFPDGTTESETFDAENRTLTAVDRAGRVTTYTYDATGRRLSTIHPDGATVSSVYDDAGQRIANVDADGNATTFTYDDAGRLTSNIDPSGNGPTFGFDAAGNQVTTTDASGDVWTWTYDSLNQLTRITHPDGSETNFGYDDLRRRVSVTDQAGATTLSGYDSLGRLTQITDALDQVTAFTYDEVGNRLTQTDANGHTTRFEHDALGRQTRRELPDGAAETWTYNADGTLATRTDFGGATQTFTYDDAQRLTNRTFADGSAFSFTYTPTGQRASVTDARGITIYAYDSRDRLTEKVDPNGYELSYAYGARGERTGITATVGALALTTTYAYDVVGRLASVTDSQGGVTQIGYDAEGKRETLELANGVVTSTTHDALNRVTALSSETSIGNVLQSFQITLGSAGNRTRIDELDGMSRSYQYDALYRLTQERVADVADALIEQRDYTYDPVGNRLSQTVDDGGTPQTITSTYDDRDRLLTAGSASYAWDADGNLISRTGDEPATYAWDDLDRLTSVTTGDGTVIETTYDADGNRVRTVTTPPGGPSTTVDYLVDASEFLSHVVADVAGGQIQTLYTRADGQLISLYRPASGDSRFYHADALGSVRLLTDATGAVTDRYTYTAYGELLEHTGSDPQPYRFAGEPFEGASELYYNRARWLDASAGRFLGADPFPGVIGEPVSLHKYQYADLNPVNATDPSGLFSVGEVNIVGSIRSIVTQIQIDVAITIVTQPSIDPRGEISKALMIATLAAGGPGIIKGVVRLGRAAKKAFQGASEWVRNGGIRRTFKAISDIIRHRNKRGLSKGLQTLATLNSKGTGVTAIGHFDGGGEFPSYVDKAKLEGASYFDIGMDAWNRVGDDVGRKMNWHFLDTQIALGDKFITNVPRHKIKVPSVLADEIKHLLKNGYTWSNSNTLVKILK